MPRTRALPPSPHASRIAAALLLVAASLDLSPAAAQRVADSDEEFFREVAREGSDDVARARALFEEASRLYTEGDLRGAVSRMEEAHRLTRAPELLFNVARIYERMSEFDDAIRWYRRYLRDSARNPAPAESTTDAAEARAAERAEIERRIAALEEAKRRVRSQVFTAPPSDDELTNEARVFFERGVAMFRRRRYEAALQAFIAARRFAPLPEILYNIAVAAERLDQRQDAIDYYREYLRSRPSAADRGLVERRIEALQAER